MCGLLGSLQRNEQGGTLVGQRASDDPPHTPKVRPVGMMVTNEAVHAPCGRSDHSADIINMSLLNPCIHFAVMVCGLCLLYRDALNS